MRPVSRLSLRWVQQIRSEAKRLDEDEEHLHNNVLHRSILATWERESPEMWRRLQQHQLADPLAKVLQARMWARKKDLMESGLPVTDAREQAERETLMLEPEAEAGSRLPDEESLPL